MCGICGAVSLTKPQAADRAVIQGMTSAMLHRGPDEDGVFFEDHGAQGPFVGIGHRRLSIVDLDTGTQPLFNEDRSIMVVANGEIYNYPKLAPQLQSDGHRLSTKSDCEAIVHLYEGKGLEFVDQLTGMFAFALWDQRKQRLVLVRDRMGVKPLHYYKTEDTLIFASEIKALLQHPLVKRQIDLKALYDYLSYEYVPAPESIIQGVKKVEPGEMLVWERGNLTRHRYWDLKLVEHEFWTMREEEYVERLEELFSIAVKRRLMSDVEVGVFLSGGVDSGLVTTWASRLYGQPMKAFTIGFEDKSFDEHRYAEKVAKLAGVELFYEQLTERKLLDTIANINDVMDEPFADPSLVPTYLLSRMTADKVKVALSGDGGDDILAGYVTYPALKVVRFYQALPTALRSRLNKLIRNLPVSHQYLSFDFKLKQFMRGEGYSSEIMFFVWLGSFNDREKRALFSPDLREAISPFNTYDIIVRYLGQSGLTSDLERILYLMMKLYLQDDILVKVDRASMASSLEVRSPFMDHELVEFVNQVPSSLKLRRLTTKYLLKKVAERVLPKDIVYRKKKGFGIPIGRWFTGELKELLTDYLSPDRIKRDGFFSPQAVQKLVDDHLTLKQDNRKPLWTLLMFQMWQERWMH